MSIRKAVVPTAGFGTRFLPVTRAVPKVMIPILDLPAIHFTVAEAAASGIEHIVFVVSAGQEAIAKYFNRTVELEQALEKQGKTELLEKMLEIPEMAEISFVYQKQQLGLGHAVLTARPLVGDEAFAVFLPDDVIWGDKPTMGSMMELFEERNGCVIAVKEVPDEAVPNLGIVDPIPLDDNISEIVRMVEKPPLDEAPSNLAIIGRYVLTAEVFDALENVTPGAVGEIQLTDAIAAVLSDQKAYAYKFPGEHFDLGTPSGMLKASIYSALRRDEYASDIRGWMESTLGQRVS